MRSYSLTPTNIKKEENIINQILINNGYNQYTAQQKHKYATRNTQKTIWSTFTYNGPEIRTITKLFHNTNIKIAFKTNTTLKRHLTPKTPIADKFNQSGVYMLKCNNCPLRYVGQTGRAFRTRFKEHIHDIKNNRSHSKYAQHILDTGHEYGPIEQIMDILHIKNKGHILNTLEQFEIYKIIKNSLQLNDTHTFTKNPIFDLLI
jgi:hypothetical protein